MSHSFRQIVSVALVVIYVFVFAPASHGDEESTGKKYWIIECTQGEMVAVGSDNNVLRWKVTEGDEQKWELVHKGANKFNIRSRKKDNLYLTIQGVTGNAHVAARREKDKEQIFFIEDVPKQRLSEILPTEIYLKYKDQEKVQFIRIMESTRDERLAVGSNGNILRWSPTTDNTQVFIFKEIQSP